MKVTIIHICKAERDMEETVAVDRLNPFVPQNVLAPVLFLQLLFSVIMNI